MPSMNFVRAFTAFMAFWALSSPASATQAKYTMEDLDRACTRGDESIPCAFKTWISCLHTADKETCTVIGVKTTEGERDTPAVKQPWTLSLERLQFKLGFFGGAFESISVRKVKSHELKLNGRRSSRHLVDTHQTSFAFAEDAVDYIAYTESVFFKEVSSGHWKAVAWTRWVNNAKDKTDKPREFCEPEDRSEWFGLCDLHIKLDWTLPALPY